MSIVLNGTTGVTTPDITSDGLTVDTTTLVVDETNNRVGIGTSSPSTPLHISGSSDVMATIESTDRYSHVDFTDTLGSSRITNDGGNLRLRADNANAVGSSYLTMEVDGSEAARIDSSGNLLVGTTSSFGAGVGFCGFANGTAALRLQRGSDSGATARFYNYNGSEVGSIAVGASSTSYVTSSDYRLKEDWIAVADASIRVNALKPVNFAWKADGTRVDGCLAHELAEVVPEAVTGKKDATEMVDVYDEEGNVTGQEERPVYQGIDQSKLVPLLTAALQEALAKIDDLTARVSALEASNV